MGYDVWANGEFKTKKNKRDLVYTTILRHLAIEEDGYGSVDEWIESEQPIPDPRYHLGDYLDNRFDQESFGVTEEDGRLSLYFTDSELRRPEEDQWIFDLIAPYCTKGSMIYFQGEDGERWLWRIENGEVVEDGSAVVYGNDANAPEVLKKIVNVIYDPENDNLPLSALQGVDHEAIISQIENIIRESGFGPQAGMNALDRLADVEA